MSGASPAHGQAENHDDIGEHQRRQQPQRRFDQETPPHAVEGEPGPRQVEGDREAGVDHQQQTKNPHSERGPGSKTERCQIAGARRRQAPRDADQQKCRARHRGGKGNVLGVVEHGAVPRAADAQADCGDQGRARTRDQSRSRRGGDDPTNAHQRAEDMAQIIGIDRNQMTEGDGNDVEQAPVEIKVLEAEDALLRQAAGIIGNDQLTVALLHFFIVGDGVILEGAKHHDA